MTDSKGYYAILGVPEKASYREIKQAYRKLARKYHPDRNRSAFAEDMIKKINAAFEVLSDESKRHQYDKADYAYSPPPPSPEHVTTESQDANPSADHQTSSASSWKVANESTVADFFNGPYSIDIPKGRFHIIVEPSLCMAFGSCETLAPKTFVVEKNKRVNPKAIVECETCEDFSKIYAAAQTCPTKAIKIVDRYTGEQIYP